MNSSIQEQKTSKFEDFMEKYIVPVLKKISGNKFLGSLMEGFYSTLPIIVFSSIIGIIMWVPPAIEGHMDWYPLEVRQFLNRIYVLSMGFVSLWFTMAIAIAMAQKLNLGLKNRQMNIIMVGFAAGAAILMMSVAGTFSLKDDGTATENFANVLVGNLGAQGMLSGILVGVTLPWIFYVPVKYGWTIKLPKAVPQGVSQSFADIIPYGLSVMFYWLFGYIFIYFNDSTFTDWLFQLIKPIFSGLDSYGFLAAVSFMTAFIWFIGVHGPSVTRPFLTPFMYSNLADNQQLFAQGLHPHWALTYEFSYDFTATMGGTGATFVIPTLFILLCKSKKLKAVGLASYIPIWFQVNEPALFGAPMILNPIFALPFFILPMINVMIYKFFIDVIGMNGAIADVPWSLPAIFGLLIGTGFDWKVFPLWSILIIIDLIGYIPFVLLHDRMCCQEEIKEAENQGIAKPHHYSYLGLLKLKVSFKPEKKALLTEINSEIAEEKQVKRLEKAEAKELFKAEQAQAKLEISQAKQKKQEIKKLKLELKEAKASNNIQLVEEISAKLNELTKSSLEVGLITSNSSSSDSEQVNILVICYGAGTSAMMAAQIEKGLAAEGISNFFVTSAAQGTHLDKIKNADIVVASPQVKMYVDDFKKQVKKGGVVIETKGPQYVQGAKDKDAALAIIMPFIPKERIKYNKK